MTILLEVNMSQRSDFSECFPYITCEDKMFNIRELKRQKKLCDVVIVEGNSYIYAHSCILAAGSPILLNKLMTLSSNEWSVLNPLRIDFSYIIDSNSTSKSSCIDCLSKVIDYMYNDKIVHDPSHLDHVTELCNFLQLSFLNSENLDSNVLSIKKSGADKNMNCHPIKSKNNILLKDNTLSDSVNSDTSYIEKTVRSNNFPIKEYITVQENDNVTKDCLDKKNNSNKVCNLLDNSENTSLTSTLSGEYSCTKCKLKFDCFKLYNYHKKVFHKKNFVCLSCNFTTLKLSYMVFHLMNMEHEEHYCSICLYKALSSNDLRVHLLDHKSDFPYKCYTCENIFRGRTEWLRHIASHSLTNDSLACQVCGDSFDSKITLNKHLLTHKDVTFHLCEICGFTAPYKSVLDRHTEKHKNKINRKKNHCPVSPCTFSTPYKYNLKEHLQSHATTKSFVCERCSLKFTLEKNLLRHLRTMHNGENNVYECCRCDYKNARVDKAKAHCETMHLNDSEALAHIMKQHGKKRADKISDRNKKCEEKTQNKITNSETQAKDKMVFSDGNSENKNISSNDVSAISGNTFILSETTGEFCIMSENKGESISVASVTSTNVLTIGNFREGTGSVTLNETTGVLTLNNINSDSTGAVFLNESTGELSYINLGNDSQMNVDHTDCKVMSKVHTQLNECTGEITVCNENDITDFNDDDGLFDSFDMDIGEDSCDGFDDLDGLLFESIDFENSDIFLSKNQDNSLTEIPHLNETTGELSFDHVDNQPDLWTTKHLTKQRSEESDVSYTLLLNEVTGELVTGDAKINN